MGIENLSGFKQTLKLQSAIQPSTELVHGNRPA